MSLRNKLLIIMAILAMITLAWGITTTEASIDYWMTETKAFSGSHNYVTINCKNGGKTDGDFYLVVTFVNASFSHQTSRPYNNVDNSTVKFRYLLHEGESADKLVYFEIDEGANSFSVHLSFEKISLILKSNRVYATTLAYEWNEEVHSYELI